MDADRDEAAILDASKQACHAVDERLAADEANMLVILGLPQQVLAGTEADFEPDLLDRSREQLREMPGCLFLEVEPKAREEIPQQVLLAGTQRPALAPAIGPERSCLGHNHRRSSPKLSSVMPGLVPGIHDFFHG
jgi:hypothetical protein